MINSPSAKSPVMGDRRSSFSQNERRGSLHQSRKRSLQSIRSETSQMLRRTSFATASIVLQENRGGVRGILISLIQKLAAQNERFYFYLIPLLLLPCLGGSLYYLLVAKQQSGGFLANELALNLEAGEPRTIEQLRLSLDLITRDIVIILGLLVTSSFVVLQMFAANFLPHTISLFFRNKGVFAILTFMCVAVLYCGITDVLVGQLVVPLIPLAIAFVLRFLAMSIAFPYFNFLVNFLSPDALIKQVREVGLDQIDAVSIDRIHKGESVDNISLWRKLFCCFRRGGKVEQGDDVQRSEKRGKDKKNHRIHPQENEERNVLGTIGEDMADDVSMKETMLKEGKRDATKTEYYSSLSSSAKEVIVRRQLEWINSVELLADIGLSTLKQKDKENANDSMLSLYTIACAYSAAKDGKLLPDHWFRLSETVRNRPDFSSLSLTSMELMIESKIWAEWKILRAYQILFETACTLQTHHLCCLAAFYTRKVGELAAERADINTLGMCIKFMNTYVRYLINAGEIRTLSGVLNEYRELATELIRLSAALSDSIDAFSTEQANTSFRVNTMASMKSTDRRASFRRQYTASSLHERRGSITTSTSSSSPTPRLNLVSSPLSPQSPPSARSNCSITSPAGHIPGRQTQQKRKLSSLELVDSATRTSSRAMTMISISKSFVQSFYNRKRDEDTRTREDHHQELKDRLQHCNESLMDILKYLRFYLILSSSKGMSIIAEMLAHDVGTLCAEAYTSRCGLHEDILSIFLTLDDSQKGTAQMHAYRGIRRAQVKLATKYLVHGENALAKEIQKDMIDEPLFRMRQLYRELIASDTEMFWEITFRPENLDYLPPRNKAVLPTFFSWFEGFTFDDIKDTSALMSPASAAELRRESIITSKKVRQKSAEFSNDFADPNKDDPFILPVNVPKSKHGNEVKFPLRIFSRRLYKKVRRNLGNPDSSASTFLLHTVVLSLVALVGLLLDYGPGQTIEGSLSLLSLQSPGKRNATDEVNLLLSGFSVATVLVFVLLCVSSMIILQLVAARYKFHPDMLSFLRDPVLYAILCFLAIASTLSTLTTLPIPVQSQIDTVLLTLAFLVSLEVALFGAYYVRLFFVLQPDRILQKVRVQAISHVFSAAVLTTSIPELLRRRSSVVRVRRASRASEPSLFPERTIDLGGTDAGSHFHSPGAPSSSRRASVDMRDPPDNISEIDFDDDVHEFNLDDDLAVASPSAATHATHESHDTFRARANLDSIPEDVKALIRYHQFAAHEHMKRICDFGFACVQQSDEQNLGKALTTLRWLVQKYSKEKLRLPHLWFVVSGKLRRTSDFINFSSTRILNLSDSKVWFEWKVFSQYLLIFEECLWTGRVEACQSISLNARLIAQILLRNDDMEAYNVATQFLNTFLRRSVTSNSVQVTNHVVMQVGVLMKQIIDEKLSPTCPPYLQIAWNPVLEKQAWFLKYYAQVALSRDLGLVAETVAQTLCEICSKSQKKGVLVHTKILDLLLTVDDMVEKDQTTLLGVRRAQIKLGCFYLALGQNHHARVVAKDLIEETHPRLVLIVQELLTTNRSEFWEVTDWGVPTDFLEPHEKQMLPIFFELLDEEKCKGGSQQASTQSVADHVRQVFEKGTDGEFGFDGFRPRTFKDSHRQRVSMAQTRILSKKKVKAGGVFRFRRASFGASASGSTVESAVVPDILYSRENSLDQTLTDFFDTVFIKSQKSSSWHHLKNRLLMPVCLSLSAVIVLVWITFQETNSAAEFWAILASLEPPDLVGQNGTNTSKVEAEETRSGLVDTTISMEMVVRSFSVIVMCSLIALQKSAARMVRHVWVMYRKDKWVQLTWFLNGITVVLALWNAISSLSSERSSLSFTTLMLSSVCILTLYPYFDYLFVFLDEERLLNHIVIGDMGLVSALSKDRISESLLANVDSLVHSLDRVTDFASTAIRVKNKNSAFKCVNALYCLALSYLNMKERLPPSFFSLFVKNPEIAKSEAFARLTKEFRSMLHEDRTWMEWKILRQCLFLFQESVCYVPDVCYRLAIITRQFAEAAIKREDLGTLDLCIKVLNTYVKISLDRAQPRLVYSVMYQYRQLAGNMLNHRLVSSGCSLTIAEFEACALDIAWYFRHYALSALKANMPFLTELINHDIAHLCVIAARKNSGAHETLLKIFFKAYDASSTLGRRGVRRTQLKLYAQYRAIKQDKYAAEVVNELCSETNLDIVASAFADLCANEQMSQTFWEINERMYNIDHLTPPQRVFLKRIVDEFPENLRALCLSSSKVMETAHLEASSFSDLPFLSNGAQPRTSQKKTANDGIGATISGFSRELALRAKAAVATNASREGEELPLFERRESLKKMVLNGEDAEEEDFASSSSLVRISWIPIVLVLALSVVLCFFVAVFEPEAIQHLNVQAQVDAQRITKTLAKSAIMIFCIVLTPTLIMLQINSRHLLGVIAEQYFKDRRVFAMLSFFATSSVYVLWVNYSASVQKPPFAAMITCTLLVCFMTLMLFPYFGTLFEFLDPNRVVRRMLQECTNLLKTCEQKEFGKPPTQYQVEDTQRQVGKILEQLGSFANASLLEKDKHNFTNVVRIISSFGEKYILAKPKLDESWFNATTNAVRNSQEFLSVEYKLLDELKGKKTWVESKMLRQFLSLFSESLTYLPEGCLLIAIETAKLSQIAVQTLDFNLIELIIQVFNTYIRAGLNKKAVRIIYNTLHQYRQMAEYLIISLAGSSSSHSTLLKYAVQVAKYLRYYASVASGMRIDFVVEIIAFDLASMCETAYLLGFDNFASNDRILAELLSMFDFLTVKQSSQDGIALSLENDPLAFRRALCAENKTNVDAIGRACCRLATLYLERGDEGRAYFVSSKLRSYATSAALRTMRDKLEAVTERDFWEINDRGANFDYLPESRREQLMRLFAWMKTEQLRNRSTTHLSSNESSFASDASSKRHKREASTVVITQGLLSKTDVSDSDAARSSAVVVVGGNKGSRPTAILDTRARNSTFAPPSVSKDGSSSGPDELENLVEDQTTSGASIQTKINAVLLGRSIIRRKLTQIRQAKAEHLKKQEALVLEDLEANKAFQEASTTSNHEKNDFLGLGEESKSLKSTSSLQRIPRSSRHSSVGGLEHAQMLRMSKKGSAYNMQELLGADMVTPKDLSEFKTIRDLRQMSISEGLVQSTRRRLQRAQANKKEKLHNPITKQSGYLWSKALYMAPLAVLAIALPGYLIDCAVGSDARETSLCSSENVFGALVLSSHWAYSSASQSTLSLILYTFLSSVVTVTTIIVQINSSRYTPRVAALFLRNIRIVTSLIVFFSSATFVQLQASFATSEYTNPIAYITSIVLAGSSFLLLMPYIAHLLQFLDAAKIFREIANDGLRNAFLPRESSDHSSPSSSSKRKNAGDVYQVTSVLTSKKDEHEQSVLAESPRPQVQVNAKKKKSAAAVFEEAKRQAKVISSLDEISDFALGALRLKDKHNAFHGIDLICAFMISYTRSKMKRGRASWYETVHRPVSKDPDFVSLSEAVISDMERDCTWVQWKALRQMLKMFEVSLGDFNDAILRIARGFRHIGQTAIRYKDIAGTNLTIKFFNTILQLAIKRGDDRAADTIILQYRFFIEYCMNYSVRNGVVDEPVSDLVADMCSHLRYYALLSYTHKLQSCAENIAHDLCTLCAFARHLALNEIYELILDLLGTFIVEFDVPDKLILDGFSKIDHVPRGVLRAMFKLASVFISEFGDSFSAEDSDVRKLYKILNSLNSSTLRLIWSDFKMLKEAEFWEVSDRGSNVDALNPMQQKALMRFFALFTNFDTRDILGLDQISKRLQGLRKDTFQPPRK